MRTRALATDYDGTIADDGRVDDATASMLARLRASGWRLVLVTGRELEDLQHVFPGLDLFDRAVVENGGVLYRPADHEVVALAPAPPEALVARLRARGLRPLGVGRVVVATSESNAAILQEEIDALGLRYRLIANKGALMALPEGVDKASGLLCALGDLGLSTREVVAVGDAENDVAFLRVVGHPVAVANALPVVKAAARTVTAGARAAGVRELADRLLTEDAEA